mgnify:FL=1
MTKPSAPDRPPTPLGAYIAEKRKAAGLSQLDLAEGVGTSQGGISNWEKGGIVPSTQFLAALARSLPGASVEDMLGLIERTNVVAS